MQYGYALGDGQSQPADPAAGSLDRGLPDGLTAGKPFQDFLGQAWPGVFHDNLGQLPDLAQAHLHGISPARVSNGIVDQIGQRAFHQMKITHQLNSPRRRPAELNLRGLVGKFELLNGVHDQFIEAEALAAQRLISRLQRRKLEQLVREPTYLVALRQGGRQHPLARTVVA